MVRSYLSHIWYETALAGGHFSSYLGRYDYSRLRKTTLKLTVSGTYLTHQHDAKPGATDSLLLLRLLVRS